MRWEGYKVERVTRLQRPAWRLDDAVGHRPALQAIWIEFR